MSFLGAMVGSEACDGSILYSITRGIIHWANYNNVGNVFTPEMAMQSGIIILKLFPSSIPHQTAARPLPSQIS